MQNYFIFKRKKFNFNDFHIMYLTFRIRKVNRILPKHCNSCILCNCLSIDNQFPFYICLSEICVNKTTYLSLLRCMHFLLNFWRIPFYTFCIHGSLCLFKEYKHFLGRVLVFVHQHVYQQNTLRTLPRYVTKPQLHYLMVRLQWYLIISP